MGAIAQMAISPEGSGWGTLAIWFGIAALDHYWPGAQTSPEPRAQTAWHTWLLRLYVPLQLTMLGLAGWVAHGATWPVALGVAFSAGWIAGGQGITFAHELGHSKSKLDRALAWVLMASVGYAHFMVEHYRGHHPRAATYEDPATSRLNESLYAFWPRTVAGGWVSGWRLEGQRLKQMKRHWLQSPLVWCVAINMAGLAAWFALGWWKVMAAWCVMAVVAFTLLEIVNYIEHYGLQRAQVGGKREPFNPMHAWNANHYVTNALLANLQRHSDHHTHAWKPYATLVDSPPPAPQLPTGYAGCLLLAMVPPLWFRIMNPRVATITGAGLR